MQFSFCELHLKLGLKSKIFIIYNLEIARILRIAGLMKFWIHFWIHFWVIMDKK